MDRIDRWKLADELTAYQIALLIAGYDPSEFERDHPDRWPEEVSQDISPFLNAIKNAARSRKIEMMPVRFESFGNVEEIDWNSSTIGVESLCNWMQQRNFSGWLFSPATHRDR